MTSYSRTVITLIIPSLLLILLTNCAKDYSTNNSFAEPISETKSLNYDYQDLVYFEQCNSWLKPEQDPYEISNIRHAAGIVNSIMGDSLSINPTHYALKVFPRNEVELNELILTRDIIINYIPFNYTQISDKEAASIEHKGAIIDTCFFQTESKYYINCGDDIIPLPVLYLAWPVDKPLPNEYDFIIEYEAFIPNSFDCDPSTLFLEQEAINCSNDNATKNKTRGSSYRTITGQIMDYDDLLGCFVNVKYLRLQLTYGLSTLETYTDQYGCFSFTGNINDNAKLKIFFENTRWRISNNNSLISGTSVLGKVSDLWASSGHHVEYLNHEVLTVHRAANFFFNGNHDISTPASSYSLRIDIKSQDRIGVFEPSPVFSPCIHINNDTTTYHEGYIFATVIHELGHFNQYQHQGGHSAYIAVHQTLRESFACYVSWYLSSAYYTEACYGFYNPTWDEIFGQNFQNWKLNWVSYAIDYTPLFIDLSDTYNQGETNPACIKDYVSGTPHWYIVSIAVDKQSWVDLRASLKTYIELCYSTSVFNDFVALYDEYFGFN